MLVHGSSWATMGREHGEGTTVAIEATPPPSVAAFENRSAGTAIWPLGDAGHNEGSCAAGNRTRLRPIKETERTWRRQRARRADCACGGRTCVHGAIADFAAPPLTLQMLRNDKWPSASSAPSEVVYVHRLCMRPIAIASQRRAGKPQDHERKAAAARAALFCAAAHGTEIKFTVEEALHLDRGILNHSTHWRHGPTKILAWVYAEGSAKNKRT
ncbi:hypothetical protein MRX96_007568 [Rhipicephalus microplus]